MQKSETIGKLAEALSKAQSEMPGALLDGRNPHFKSQYATLASVRNAAIPTLSKHGLTVSQLVSSTPNGHAVETILMHASGEWLSGIVELIVEKNNMQGLGSAITYCRRYSLAALVGVVDQDDDDGNQAVIHAPKSKPEPVKAWAPSGKDLQDLWSVAQSSGWSAEEMNVFSNECYSKPTPRILNEEEFKDMMHAVRVPFKESIGVIRQMKAEQGEKK